LTGWMTICETFRKRGKSNATGNFMASKEQELVLTRVLVFTSATWVGMAAPCLRC
jgi:hypothetical protein